MAKYQVTHSCGHTVTHQLYGKNSERERKIEWMEGKLCADCYKAQKDLERKQANERSADLASDLGFAQLTGSDKQIAWAQTIRQECYETIIKRNYILDADVAIKVLSLETSSKWWIDNRDEEPIGVIRLICANYKDRAKQIEAEFLAAKKAS